MFLYYYAILAVLVIGLVCLLVIHRAHREDESETGAANTMRTLPEIHSEDKLLWAARDQQHRLVRELDSVRTPWGWPRHKADLSKRDSGLSEPMKSFTDSLVRRKNRLAGSSAESRGRQSVRALIEDRYVPSKWNSPSEIEYRKVKPPLLRDPNAPHDQMDNFGVKQAELIRKKLQRVAKMNVEAAAAAAAGQRDFRYVSLKDVKQPWGW
jgi:hypothetical protein